MPFTFSHPAIILPLAKLSRKWFSLTGLVVGSLAPDFEYFLRLKIKSIHSHTIEGLVYFDLPIGILVAFIFHNLVRNSLFNNLPMALKGRLINFKKFDWNNYFIKNWIVVVSSILIGAASHIFWDSFTHDSGYFVQKIPFLEDTIKVENLNIPVLKVFQHASTLIGGFAIVFTIYNLPYKEVDNQRVSFNYWITVFVIAVITISARFYGDLKLNQYGNIIVTMISAMLLGITLTPLLLKKSK